MNSLRLEQLPNAQHWSFTQPPSESLSSLGGSWTTGMLKHRYLRHFWLSLPVVFQTRAAQSAPPNPLHLENTSQSAATLNWVSKTFLSMTDRMNGQIIDGYNHECHGDVFSRAPSGKISNSTPVPFRINFSLVLAWSQLSIPIFFLF